jgi:biotin synthase
MKTVEDAPSAGTEESRESPQYVRTSLAAAMTMGKIPGKFYRDAKLYCINLLLTYDEGCHAKCAYCGLSGSRESETDWTDSSFIRVDWPIYSIAEIKQAITDGTCPHVERVCISMITLGNAREDCITVVKELSDVVPRISVLITPTIINKDWLMRVKEAGADKVGIAVDAATEEIFDKLRGKEVQGPHKWSKYWDTVKESVEVFGRENVGIHLIVGVGETEKEMLETIQRAEDMGARTHLFSFFPEEGSVMEDHPQPPIGSYRRVQLGRYIINYNHGNYREMTFNELGQLTHYGLSKEDYERVSNIGEAFKTSGCKGDTQENACNRPMGNCTPFQASIGHWRNMPIDPNDDDMSKILDQLGNYSLTYEVDDTYLDDE